jgi:nucleoside-diphosphate-sugar epimerase
MHVDDLADAALFPMLRYDDAEIIDVSAREDITICEIAGMVTRIVIGDARYSTRQCRSDAAQAADASRLDALCWLGRIRHIQSVSSRAVTASIISRILYSRARFFLSPLTSSEDAQFAAES